MTYPIFELCYQALEKYSKTSNSLEPLISNISKVKLETWNFPSVSKHLKSHGIPHLQIIIAWRAEIMPLTNLTLAPASSSLDKLDFCPLANQPSDLWLIKEHFRLCNSMQSLIFVYISFCSTLLYYVGSTLPAWALTHASSCP